MAFLITMPGRAPLRTPTAFPPFPAPFDSLAQSLGPLKLGTETTCRTSVGSLSRRISPRLRTLPSAMCLPVTAARTHRRAHSSIPSTAQHQSLAVVGGNLVGL